ncbi:hypothetical protein D1094_10960 [Colwellia sp. RSH04]|nr:hypothetical protein D1094_10960 [Colwellia sp. RSH04]
MTHIIIITQLKEEILYTIIWSLQEDFYRIQIKYAIKAHKYVFEFFMQGCAACKNKQPTKVLFYL